MGGRSSSDVENEAKFCTHRENYGISGSINEASPTTEGPEYIFMAVLCAAESRALIKKERK